METIVRIGLIGVTAAILAAFLKKEKAEFSMMIGIGAGIIMFYFVLSRISVVIGFLNEILDMVSIEETYFSQLLKMLGVAYTSEFAAAICKDAGQQSIAGMIELFAKLSIVTLSIPGIVFLVETLGQFI